MILYVPADMSTEDILTLRAKGFDLIFDFDKEGVIHGY